MSDTAARLARYVEAETLILQGQRVRLEDGREVAMPDLQTVSAEIGRLRTLLQSEQIAAAGGSLVGARVTLGGRWRP